MFGRKSQEALDLQWKIADSCYSLKHIAQGEKAAKKLLLLQEEIFGEESEKLIKTLLLIALFVFQKYMKHLQKHTLSGLSKRNCFLERFQSLKITMQKITTR